MLDETEYSIRLVPEALVYRNSISTLHDYYAQCQRQGAAMQSWSARQPGYAPPPATQLEASVLGSLTSHIEALEAANSREDSVFSALRATGQLAHLVGYLQAALEGASPGSPSLARELGPACNVCGSKEFVQGPGGRMSRGILPQCRDCGSLERHRQLHDFLTSSGQPISTLTCLSVGGPLLTTGKLFRTCSSAPFADVAVPSDQQYDVVVGINLLTNNPNVGLTNVLKRLVRHLHSRSILIMYESALLDQADSARFDTHLARSLPNVRVTANRLVDRVTGESAVVAAAQATDAAKDAFFSLKPVRGAEVRDVRH
jgi:hypothetical protein